MCYSTSFDALSRAISVTFSARDSSVRSMRVDDCRTRWEMYLNIRQRAEEKNKRREINLQAAIRHFISFALAALLIWRRLYGIFRLKSTSALDDIILAVQSQGIDFNPEKKAEINLGKNFSFFFAHFVHSRFDIKLILNRNEKRKWVFSSFLHLTSPSTHVCIRWQCSRASTQRICETTLLSPIK